MESIRTPTFRGTTTAESLKELQSALFRMTEQLNVALGGITVENLAPSAAQGIVNAAGLSTERQQQQEYSALRSLIIKTADTVTALGEEIRADLSADYLAKSDFGTYTESASAALEANATAITQTYQFVTDVQAGAAATDVSFQSYRTQTEAFIHTGLLYYDADNLPVYGVAVGNNLQTETVDGNEVLRKTNQMATFEAERVAFWLNGGVVAYLSNSKLYITNTEITGSMRVGGFLVISNSSGFTIKTAE